MSDDKKVTRSASLRGYAYKAPKSLTQTRLPYSGINAHRSSSSAATSKPSARPSNSPKPSTTSPPPPPTSEKRKRPLSPSSPPSLPPPNANPSKRPASSTTTRPSPLKKRKSSGYAPPSKYAHITNKLRDSLLPNLICLYIGVNPGIQTATDGHAYAHPSNLFWKLAFRSGCTPRLCRPAEDVDLPHLYALGHTNIVSRPTKDASELSKEEMGEGVAVLEEKCRKWRPEAVCLVGKSIWETVFRIRRGRAIRKEEFRYGWQDERENMGVVVVKKKKKKEEEEGEDGEEGWGGARVFVATTTSGLAAGMKLAEKEAIWRELGEFVERRRKERGIPDEGMKRVDAKEV